MPQNTWVPISTVQRERNHLCCCGIESGLQSPPRPPSDSSCSERGWHSKIHSLCLPLQGRSHHCDWSQIGNVPSNQCHVPSNQCLTSWERPCYIFRLWILFASFVSLVLALRFEVCLVIACLKYFDGSCHSQRCQCYDRNLTHLCSQSIAELWSIWEIAGALHVAANDDGYYYTSLRR
jgi:hypothetical protein